MSYKTGDVVNLPQGTKVRVTTGITVIEGEIVGKTTNDLTQTHIVKCTCGYIPNETYEYDTLITPLHLISLI